MMHFSQTQLITLQREAKLARNYYQLAEPVSVKHEFCHRLGHPSSYAFVRFDCSPATELSFESVASWPDSVPADYRLALERAIAEGVTDTLFEGLYPKRGCTVRLMEVRYDEIGSSEAVFLWAATRAMQDLKNREWKIIITEPTNVA